MDGKIVRFNDVIKEFQYSTDNGFTFKYENNTRAKGEMKHQVIENVPIEAIREDGTLDMQIINDEELVNTSTTILPAYDNEFFACDVRVGLQPYSDSLLPFYRKEVVIMIDGKLTQVFVWNETLPYKDGAVDFAQIKRDVLSYSSALRTGNQAIIDSFNEKYLTGKRELALMPKNSLLVSSQIAAASYGEESVRQLMEEVRERKRSGEKLYVIDDYNESGSQLLNLTNGQCCLELFGREQRTATGGTLKNLLKKSVADKYAKTSVRKESFSAKGAFADES